jgi:HD superfamily phosphohydrolase YqeK
VVDIIYYVPSIPNVLSTGRYKHALAVAEVAIGVPF